MRVADVHTHIFPDKLAEKASDAIGIFYDKPSNHTASLQVLKEQEALAGVDYFLVSERIKDKITAAEIHSDVLGSDHCPVVLEIDL